MVKFQIASDLHIEFKNDCNITDIQSYIIPGADILILAGDIGNLYKLDQLKDFLSQLSRVFRYILYVPGNHEFYRTKEHKQIPFDKLSQRLAVLEKEISNLVILNRNSVCIDDVCVVGCTLWTDAKCDVPPFIVRIKGMNQEMYNNMHRRDLKYIYKMMKYCREKKLKMLMVSHHCPTYKVLKCKTENEQYISLYATELDYLLRGDYVHTWVCGHNHVNYDFLTVLGTRLVSNQRGKPRDNIVDFSTVKIIEV